MKKLINVAVAALCTGAVALTLTGCSGRSAELGKPAAAVAFAYSEREDEGYLAIKGKADNFAYKLSEAAYSGCEGGENFSVAPISVFSALSLAAECANGETRRELLSALDIGYEDLSAQFSKLYRSLDAEYYSSGGSLSGMLKQSNSVWINKGVKYNADCVRNLSEKYFSYSYSADFRGGNAGANKAVRSFVKDSTKGLIDKDFKLSDKTVFTLINALYIKDIWNDYGKDLGFTEDKYTFTEYDGNAEQLRLLSGYYQSGKALEREKYTAFYTQTLHRYKIKFLVPKEGYSVGDIFTAENLAEVNSESDYDAVDDVNRKLYHTRCLFPEFKTSADCDLKEILKNNFAINTLFDFNKCDMSSFTGERVACDGVKHVNTLTVNKKGIEGAAVTVIPMAGAGAPLPYEHVYLDFIVDRAFGFILTNSDDTVIFSGIVNGIDA